MSCGSYSVELTPYLDFLSISKSGAVGPDGITSFYDTLTVDQIWLIDSDIGTHEVTMRVYQDVAVDGWTSPVAGQISSDVTYTFDIIVTTCSYINDHAQEDFVASSTLIIGNLQSLPYTITFPSFILSPSSAASCGAVTQFLDTNSLPADWTVNYSDSGDNSIEFASFDSASEGVYSLSYSAYMGSFVEYRALTLSFEVVYCEYETVHS